MSGGAACFLSIAVQKAKGSFYALSIFLLAANFNLSYAFAAEESYTLEPIVILPTKSSFLPSSAVRKVEVIDAEQIRRLPVHSVAELIAHTLGTDIRQRGALGVQADLNMRGANFEQVLICINGLRLNDAQTGHHNLDLPITLMDIERVEILPGQGLSSYGPGAFGGTINLVTKKPKAKGLEVELGAGSFGLNSQELSVNYPLGKVNNRLSFARKESSGWRPDTDFRLSSLSLNSQRNFSFAGIEYLFGYTDKDFGADSFYSNLYPREEEHTDTRFFNLKAHIKNEILELKSDFYFRRHADKFILDRTRPDLYVNYHTTYSYGGDLAALMEFDFCSLLMGSEMSWDKITSTRLGKHLRERFALYTQLQSSEAKRTVWNLGVRLEHFQTWGWKACPDLNLGYSINPQLRWKSSFGRAFRAPSFTDLYYQSPANVGNENLTLEEAWSADTGLEYNKGAFFAELTCFSRWADDLIGWVRPSAVSAWQAQNIAEVDTQGIELELALKRRDGSLIFSKIYAGYAYQYSESEGMSLNTKYTLDFLKHHARLGFDLRLPGDFTQALRLSYKESIGQRPYFLLDSRIAKQIEQDGFDLEIFLDISNLLNTSYSEQTDVPLPGRWIIGGFRLKI